MIDELFWFSSWHDLVKSSTCITCDPAIPLLIISFKGNFSQVLKRNTRGCSLKCALRRVVVVLVRGGKEFETILNWHKYVINKMKNYGTISSNRSDIHSEVRIHRYIQNNHIKTTAKWKKEMRIIKQNHLHRWIIHTYKTNMPFLKNINKF